MKKLQYLSNNIDKLRDNLYDKIEKKHGVLTDQTVILSSCILNKEINKYYELVYRNKNK
ncbi:MULTISPECIES: Spo0E family sporulation regulatory protein-aspartic acid phosphatase [Clostridium]|uniref:Spo0E family sporulation regulatory protein-aspartic acid phosphatase n=1 Tax=Clostridium TaxID=1485 RepID=UPI0009BE7D53|nr:MULTISPECIES: Spo0E family sporulation regulatory protein-aspartic acid phosphatase [Clostridium]PJI09283.1 Spo0E family sporulation regulatory protein-aspartic acid phosphatase [Clostridium sp. CT7]